MAGNLKQRLFDRLELGDANLGDAELEATESALSSAPSEAKLSPFLTVRSQDVQWQPHPVPGVETAIFYSNPVKREIVGLLRASAGCRYPFHRHAATEDLYMLEGELVIGDEIYGVGDYIHSEPGTAHAPYTTTGCTFFFHTSMDDEYPQVATAESV
jgi:quercetin dioxygenase-like cupin family protein